MKCKYKFNFRIGEAYIFDCEHCMKRSIIMRKRFWGRHA